MKIRSLFPTLLIGVLVQTLPATAGDLYLVNLRGTCRTIVQANRMVTRPITTGTIIRDCVRALSNSPPDVHNLRLAYDVDADKISVVDITTGRTACEFVMFDESEWAPTQPIPDTLRLRHVYLINRPTLDGSVGSAVLTEYVTRDINDTVVHYSASGTFHYIVRETETTPMQACTGTFSVGRKLSIASPSQ